MKFDIKIVFLILLCLQNSIYTLLRRYTQMAEGYSSSSVLCVGEVIKGFAKTVKALQPYH